MIQGKIEEAIDRSPLSRLSGKVQLILTSPPFPLNRRKNYGNLTGEEYAAWLSSLAGSFRKLLKSDGSIVIELGNAWVRGRPIMSTLPIKTLMMFLKKGDLQLCQEFINYNPARLPSPIQWVNIERIRVKDSFTRVWWMSPSDRPKSDNRSVLKDYSKRMLKLLEAQHYNSGRRPSQHTIGRHSFLRNNGGSIPSNVLLFPNTDSSDAYLKYCKVHGLRIHPTRMPLGMAEFFIRFLTSPRDYVLDPFAGSNVTGAVSESLGRKWVSVEPELDFVKGSIGRFGRRKTSITKGML